MNNAYLVKFKEMKMEVSECSGRNNLGDDTTKVIDTKS